MTEKTTNLIPNNGDVFDIGQTVNGVSRFLWLNNSWYYFEERMTKKNEYNQVAFVQYEYDQKDLTKLITENEFDEVNYLGNLFSKFD